MPYTSYADAEDAMLTQFKTAWDAQSMPVPTVIYDDTLEDPPDGGTEYARVYVRNNIARASAIGNTRFRHWGILFVEVYTKPGDGKARNQELGMVVVHAFQGKNTGPDGVWYRDVSYREQGQDKGYFKGIVQAAFQWDEALPRPGLA